MKIFRSPLLALSAAMLLSGCFGAPLTGPGSEALSLETDPVKRELQRLAREVEQINQARASSQAATGEVAQRLALLEKEINTLRGMVEEASHALQQSNTRLALLEQVPGAPMAASGQPGQPMAAPTGAVSQLATQAGASAQAGPTLVAAAAQPQARVPTSAPAQPTAAPAPPAAPAPTAPSPEAAYDAAFLLLKSGQYPRALASFESFLSLFPDHGRAPNAQYWIGESHYVQQNFQEALQAFNKVLMRWPTSDKVPGSLLKIGFSLFELGEFAKARAVLVRLTNDFPRSPTLHLARSRLQMIDQRLQQQAAGGGQ